MKLLQQKTCKHAECNRQDRFLSSRNRQTARQFTRHMHTKHARAPSPREARHHPLSGRAATSRFRVYVTPLHHTHTHNPRCAAPSILPAVIHTNAHTTTTARRYHYTASPPPLSFPPSFFCPSLTPHSSGAPGRSGAPPSCSRLRPCWRRAMQLRQSECRSSCALQAEPGLTSAVSSSRSFPAAATSAVT